MTRPSDPNPPPPANSPARQQSRRLSPASRVPVPPDGYFPARRCQRVAFSIFLCFFFRMRLRRFFISDPMSSGRLVEWERYAPCVGPAVTPPVPVPAR